MIDKVRDLQMDIKYILSDEKFMNELYKVKHLYNFMMIDMSNTLQKADHLFRILWCESYIREVTKKNVDVLREELMQKAWHPRRLEWCLDFEEYRELFQV
jgi:hypothetical protein